MPRRGDPTRTTIAHKNTPKNTRVVTILATTKLTLIVVPDPSCDTPGFN
jgi:hypothetical protein